MKLRPIGIVRSPFKRVEDIPRECRSIVGEIEVFKEYEPGLEGIEKVSHIIILWLFHKSKGCSLRVKPLHHEDIRGVFATRHPDRPNPIGLTVVELLERRGRVLKVRGIDTVDGTPVVDIKPRSYIWQSEGKHQNMLDDK
jgi:tRNA-Thr(GGU) m(6)t(6)A37 methyltransferase TsaA